MGAADDDGDIVHGLDLGGMAPGLFDLGGVGGDADDMRAKFLHEFFQ